MTLEVVQFRKQGDKWRPQRLGYAKKNDKGQLQVYLDALPIPDGEGNVRLVVQERQQQQSRETYSQPVSDTTASAGGLEDEIPF